MKSVTVALGDRSYPIVMVPDLPGQHVAHAAVSNLGMTGRRCFLVTDSNVAPLYAKDTESALRGVGIDVSVFVVPAGEDSKNMETLGRGLDKALMDRIGRKDFVVALGGGVIGDIAGLMASLLHRGIPVIQVPTTLLAQIDSSVGGKTAVNHSTGKNLIGTFWQPHAVIASQIVLQTLEPRHVRSGLAEGLKHAVIRSPQLFERMVNESDRLLACNADAIAHLVTDCCMIKAKIVAEDERDHGQRALLNFGHTLGHGFEAAAGFGTLTHGEAVGLGMVLAAELSVEFDLTAGDTVLAIIDALKELQLPHVPLSEDLPQLEAVLDAARSDKKGDGKHISFILIEKLGSPLIRRFEWSQIEKALESYRRRA